jgi:hypothetical protein
MAKEIMMPRMQTKVIISNRLKPEVRRLVNVVVKFFMAFLVLRGLYAK